LRGHRGERGAIAAVAFEHVLQHFFTPFVFEIHVDVRRLVALQRDEAFEQHLHLHGIDRGDAQHVADHRVGRRTATLAENIFRTGEAHDVVHGQKIRGVLFGFDQRQLVRDLLLHPIRRAARPAPLRAGLRQMLQPRVRRLAVGHQFFRVGILQFFQMEMAALGNDYTLRQQRRRIDCSQRLARAQMPLTVGKQAVAGLRHGGLVTDCGERVLQRAARAHVHVHVAAGDQRQLQTFAQRLQSRELGCIVRAAMQLRGEPAAVRKA
jgi:hypothetical protein